MFRTISLVGLFLYFAILLYVVSREKKSNNALDFFFAGRNLPFWMLSIAFISAWWGAGSALSTADLAFHDGFGAYWYYGVPVLISTLLMIASAKKIRKVGFLTQGKMMEARYSKSTAYTLSIMIFIFMVLSVAVQMVGIGDFFGTYLGIRYEVAVIFGTSIVLIYSLMGGFRGVVMTDIVQFVLLLISALIVFAVAFSKAGGLEGIAVAADSRGRADYMSFFAYAPKYMMYVITFGCAWFTQANVWQLISATKDSKEAKKMTVMSFVCYIPLYLIVVLSGMAGSVLYEQLPEGGIVTAIVTDQMPSLLGALVFVGITAAIMSTMDALVNSAALTLTLDLSRKQRDEREILRFSRFSTLVVVCIAILIAVRIQSILELSWISSDIITTGVFVPLLGGFIWKRGNSQGAKASMIFGLIFCLYNFMLSVGVPLYQLWDPHSTIKIIVGVAISLVLYVGVSLLTPPEYEKAERFINMAKHGNKDENSL